MLTPEEEQELAMLEQMQGATAPVGQVGLTPEEEQELAMLEQMDAAPPKVPESTSKPPSAIEDKTVNIKGNKVIEEQHPRISTQDRLVVKNLAQSPKAAAMYLVKKYPNSDIKLVDGRILFRDPTEKTYRVVDPDTGIFSSDILSDVGDVVYDVGAGIGEGVASIAGGVSGAALGGGVGALPGAMAAGGAAGAGAEALRQKLGQQLGIPQEVDMGDVATAGAFSTVSPLLFGAGGKVATEIGKRGGKKLLSERLAKVVTKAGPEDSLRRDVAAGLAKLPKTALQTLESQGVAERGVLGEGARQATAGLGELLSGVRGSVIRKSTDPNLTPKLNEIIDVGEELHANKVLTKLDNKIDDKLKDVGKEIGEKVRKSGEKINISKAKENIQKEIAELENLKNSDISMTPAEEAQLDELKDIYQGAFQKKKEVMTENGPEIIFEDIPDEVDASDVFRIKSFIADNAEFLETSRKQAGQAQGKRASFMQPVQRKTAGLYGDLREAINDKIGASSKLNKEYQQALQDRIYYSQNFRDKARISPKDAPDSEAFMNKGFKTLRQIGYGSEGKKNQLRKLKQFDERYGTSVAEDAQNLAAADLKANSTYAPRSLGGTTSTTRTLSGGAIGGGLGAFAGSGLDSEGGRPLGGAAGAALGALLAGPKAFQKFLKFQNRFRGPLDPKAREAMINAADIGEE